MPKPRWSFFMPARDHSFIKWFSANSYAWLTPHGMTLVTALFVSTGIASPGLHVSAYVMTSIILSILLTAFIASFFFVPKVEVYRRFPNNVHAGDHCIYQVAVTNIGRRPAYDVYVTEGILPFGLYYAFDHADYENSIAVLRPGETQIVTLVIRCRYRGVYNLPRILIGSSYPLNLVRRPILRGQKEKLTVYPKYEPQYQFELPLQSVFQPGGIAISTTKGESNEFFGTREYRYGDRLKDIHWAGFAHTGKLIVKEYIDEYFVRTAIFVDTQFFRRRKNRHLERRIALAAGIADGLSNRGYLVDVLAVGESIYEFEKGNPVTYLDDILKILAGTDGRKSLSFDHIQMGLKRTLAPQSSAVVILGDWDEPRSQLCQYLKNLGINVRIVIVQNGDLSSIPDQDVTVSALKDKSELVQ